MVFVHNPRIIVIHYFSYHMWVNWQRNPCSNELFMNHSKTFWLVSTHFFTANQITAFRKTRITSQITIIRRGMPTHKYPWVNDNDYITLSDCIFHNLLNPSNTNFFSVAMSTRKLLNTDMLLNNPKTMAFIWINPQMKEEEQT